MGNRTKIISNDLDQAPKVWKEYENRLNDFEVHKEIVDAFDIREKAETIEKERKDAAIVELERHNLKTHENMAKVNAVKFLNEWILIWKTLWAYEDMKWGKWVFKEKTNGWYYNGEEAITEAEKQWLTLPTKQDFENTFEALLPVDWGTKILWIILWEPETMGCVGDNDFDNTKRKQTWLGSISRSERDPINAFLTVCFPEGKFFINSKHRHIYRPIIRKS